MRLQSWLSGNRQEKRLSEENGLSWDRSETSVLGQRAFQTHRHCVQKRGGGKAGKRTAGDKQSSGLVVVLSVMESKLQNQTGGPAPMPQ